MAISPLLIFGGDTTPPAPPPVASGLKPGVLIEAFMLGVWANISADVIAPQELVIRRGISGSGPGDRLANTGTAKFALRNDAGNSAKLLGYYSLYHANKRSGWGLGIPLRITLIDPATSVGHVCFVGTIDVIDPAPGLHKERRVVVIAVDWLDNAANWRITPEVGPQINRRDDELLTTIINAMPAPPVAVSLDMGLESYPYAFDTSEGLTAFSEFSKLAFSGLTYIYIKADGTFRSESRYQRLLDVGIEWTVGDSDLVNLTLPSTRDEILNSVRVIEHPKIVDPLPTTQVYDQANSIYVNAGETKQLLGPYRDPLTGDMIGATEIQGLTVPGGVLSSTYYTATTQEDGGGSDVTADFSVVVTLGPSGARFLVTNSGGAGSWLTRLQLVGRGIYDRGATSYEARDTVSIAEVGERVAVLDMPYQAAGIAQGAAEYLLAKYRDPFAQARTITVLGSSPDRLTQILTRDISDCVLITETMTGLSGRFFINGVELGITQENLAEVTYTLAPAFVPIPGGGYWILGTSVLGVDTIPAPF